MEQHIPQEEIRRIIISDMVKKRSVFVKPNADMLACMLRRAKRRMRSNSIVPVIGEDTIVFSLGVPLILHCFSYKTLKRIRSAFKEGSKVMRRYTRLTNISALAHEAEFVAIQTNVLVTMKSYGTNLLL